MTCRAQFNSRPKDDPQLMRGISSMMCRIIILLRHIYLSLNALWVYYRYGV